MTTDIETLARAASVGDANALNALLTAGFVLLGVGLLWLVGGLVRLSKGRQ